MEHTGRAIKLLIAVVDRSQGEQAAGLLEAAGTCFRLVCLGRGTANSEILDYLGLGESEKAILIATAGPEAVHRALQAFREQMDFDKPGRGIAFTVPVNSVGGMMTLQILEGKVPEK